MRKIRFYTAVLAAVLLLSVFGAIPFVGRAYEAVEEVAGDVNGDWKTTSADYILLKQIFGGKQVLDRVRSRADVNRDMRVSSVDYTLLKRLLSGQNISVPAPSVPAQPPISDPGKPVTYTVSGAFSSDMVLQRDQVIRVWGKSTSRGSYIYGEFMGEKRYAQVDRSGNWMLYFSPHSWTAEGQTLTIGPKNGKQTVYENILLGDVWMVSGQSNAEYSFGEMAVYYTDVWDRVDPADQIRLYREDKSDAYKNGQLIVHGQQDDPVNPAYRWEKTDSATIPRFSAAGYIFIKELYDRTGIPQGMIMATAGGCMIEDFMDPTVGARYADLGTFWPERQAIYKYFIAPFRHMALTGILFYQGESDNRWAERYPAMLADCVRGWRGQFDSPFAFYNIQCTSHGALASNPDWRGLPFLRAAQLDAFYQIPNSYLISTVDVGYRLRPADEPTEDYAHPFDKITIGLRAANIALARKYSCEGYSYPYCAAPIPEEISWQEESVTIRFRNVGDGLTLLQGNVPEGFKILQNNKTLVKTSAVLLSSDTVKIDLKAADRKVLAVCYGIEHSALPEEANLGSSGGVACPTFCFYKNQQIEIR